MNILINNNKNSEYRLGKVSKRHFGRSKGNTSTALYNMLYKKTVQKGMIIPKEFQYTKHTDYNGYIKRYTQYNNRDHPVLRARQSLGDLFPEEFKLLKLVNDTPTVINDTPTVIIGSKRKRERYIKPATQALGELFPEQFEIVKNKYHKEILESIDNFLDYKNFIHKNKRTQSMINYLVQNKRFLKQMISYSLENQMKEGRKNLGKGDITDTANIRLHQLYNKLTVFNKMTDNPRKLGSLKSLQNYKVYHYIDNLIFTEFLCQILGIAGHNELIINDKLYHIYTASIHDDLYKGVDIVLKDDKENIIGIDITLSKKKQSGINELSNDKFSTVLIANYTPIKEYFQDFYTHITEYLYSKDSQPMLDVTYTDEEKKLVEDRLSSILHLENNTPSSPDQDTDNNVSQYQS